MTEGVVASAEELVEIGYAVAPAARGRGFATAAARQLVDRARERGAILCVAHTLPEANASTAVLEGSGFHKTAQAVDDEGRVVWRWERALA